MLDVWPFMEISDCVSVSSHSRALSTMKLEWFVERRWLACKESMEESPGTLRSRFNAGTVGVYVSFHGRSHFKPAQPCDASVCRESVVSGVATCVMQSPKL